MNNIPSTGMDIWTSATFMTADMSPLHGMFDHNKDIEHLCKPVVYPVTGETIRWKQRESPANTKKRLNGTDWLDLLSIITTPTLLVGMELDISVLDLEF